MSFVTSMTTLSDPKVRSRHTNVFEMRDLDYIPPTRSEMKTSNPVKPSRPTRNLCMTPHLTWHPASTWTPISRDSLASVESV